MLLGWGSCIVNPPHTHTLILTHLAATHETLGLLVYDAVRMTSQKWQEIIFKNTLLVTANLAKLTLIQRGHFK